MFIYSCTIRDDLTDEDDKDPTLNTKLAGPLHRRTSIKRHYLDNCSIDTSEGESLAEDNVSDRTWSCGSSTDSEEDSYDSSDEPVLEAQRKKQKKSHCISKGGETCAKEVHQAMVPGSEDDSDDNVDDMAKRMTRLTMLSGKSDYKVGNGDDLPSADEEEDADELGVDEDTISRDVRDPHIYVTKVIKSKVSKYGKTKKNSRQYNAGHYCPFCGRRQTNFSHHILSRVHSEEAEVKKILGLGDGEKAQKERRKGLDLLRLKGDHKHNVVVCRRKKGEIIIPRRSANIAFNVDNYLPCPRCYEWVRSSMIHRHQKVCIRRPEDQALMTKASLTVQSKVILNKIPSEASQILVKEVFPIMKEDEVGKVAKADPLIINLGNQWMMRNIGNRIMRKYYTSSVMRLAAKLLRHVQQLTKTSMPMSAYLCPNYFHTVATAALKCAQQEAVDEEELKSPSNAIKLGFDLKRLASAKLGAAIVSGEEQTRKDAEDFLRLMNLEWSTKVSKLARTLLTERSFNRRKPLPLPSDVRKLSKFLTEQLTNADYSDATYTNFRMVAVLSLARITLYNRRRSHEVQAITYVFSAF